MTTVDLMSQEQQQTTEIQGTDIFALVSEIVNVLSSEGVALMDLDCEALEQNVERVARKLGENPSKDLLDLVKAHSVGYGILDRFVTDPKINNVFLNRFDDIWIQSGLKRFKTDVSFTSTENVQAFIRILQSKLGGEINHDKARETFFDPERNLRIVCVIEPVALSGPTIVIRIHRGDDNFSLDDLIALEMLTESQARYILERMKSGANPIFAGIGGAGKTTLMRALLEQLPPDRRIMTMEEEAELQLKKSNVLPYLVKRNERGQIVGMKEFIDLGIKSSIDSFVFGENRGEEALSLIMAAYSGHQVISTLHTKKIQDVPERLAINMKMSGTDIPMDILLAMIGKSVDLIIQMDKFKVVDIGVVQSGAAIYEVKGLCKVTSCMEEVTHFEDPDGTGTRAFTLDSDSSTAL